MLTLVAAVTEPNADVGRCIYNLRRPLVIQYMQSLFTADDFFLNKHPTELGFACEKQFANKIFFTGDVLLVEFAQ